MARRQNVLAALFFSAAYVATVEAGGQERESPRPAPKVAWATYWGAGGANNRTVSIDRAGNVYMCGGTNSKDWRTTTGVRHAGGSDVTIAKFDPLGRRVWSTLLGGPSEDYAYVSEVNEKGELYVSGRAGVGFPTTKGAFDETFNGGRGGGPHSATDAFVVKLSTDGKVIYSTYIGGSGDDNGRAIHLLPSGKLVVGGGNSTSADLPTDRGTCAGPVLKPQRGGAKDSWVAVVAADGRSLDFCTYIGPSDDTGRGDETVRALGADRDGNIWIGGTSSGTDVQPTPDAFQKKRGGASDAFVAKISPDGRKMLYFSWIGGGGPDDIETEGVSDDEGNFYVAGSTGSADFPTTPGAFQTAPKRGGAGAGARVGCGWVAKVGGDGRLVFATLYGGSPPGVARFFGPAIDRWGYVYCSGWSSSTDAPLTPDAFQPKRAGTGTTGDALLVVLSPDGQRLVYGTYLGGSGGESGRHIAVQPDGSAVCVTGETQSKDFPLMNPVQKTPAGAFLARFVLRRSEGGVDR